MVREVISRQEASLRSRNIVEAVIGFLGWWVLNTVLWVAALRGESGTLLLNSGRLIPMVVTISLLLALLFTRRMIALGMLAAMFVNSVGLLLFIAPGSVLDQRSGRIVAMLPFYLYYFFPGL